MKTPITVALVLIAVLFIGCSAVTVYRYTCDGKCSGELSRDVDANTPEQLKGTKK